MKRGMRSDGTSDWLGRGSEHNASRFIAVAKDGDGIGRDHGVLDVKAGAHV